MADSLERISRLQRTLIASATKEQAAVWWRDYRMLSLKIEADKSASAADHNMVVSLGLQLSELIGDIGRGASNFDVGGIDNVLTALRTSIEKRTTGINGWPAPR